MDAKLYKTLLNGKKSLEKNSPATTTSVEEKPVHRLTIVSQGDPSSDDVKEWKAQLRERKRKAEIRKHNQKLVKKFPKIDLDKIA